MGFTEDIARINAMLDAREALVFDGVEAEAFRSIVEGSAITGAPGQPVAPGDVPNAGKLRDSWTKERLGERESLISSDVEYAPDVEDNLQGFTYHNHGPHSVKLTVAGFSRLVDHVVRRVVANG